jgi:hypothetical protein
MTMDISYAMLFLLWLVIVLFILSAVWSVVSNRSR